MPQNTRKGLFVFLRQLPGKIFKGIFRPTARGKTRWGVFFVLLMVVFLGSYAQPKYWNQSVSYFNGELHKISWLKDFNLPHFIQKDFRLGLDLQGGVQLVYQGDLSKVEAAGQRDAMQGVRDVVERRVNSLGVAEAIVQVAGADRLVVELPGVVNVEEAIKSIGETPLLEFKEQNDAPPDPLTDDEKKQLVQYNKDAQDKAREALVKLTTKKSTFEELVKEYSEDDASIKDKGGDLGFVSKNLSSQYFNEAQKIGVGNNSRTLFKSDSGYEILRVETTRNTEKEVKARHLLICYSGAKGCDRPTTKDEALKLAEDLKAKATHDNFQQLAIENSTEPNADKTGGDLGYFAKGQMVKAFEDVVFPQAVRTIIGPIETEFGYHLINKTDERPIKEFQVKRLLVKTRTESDYQKQPEPFKGTGLTGAQLKRAQVQFDNQTSDVLVGLEFNDEGRKLFKEITERNLQKPVAIYLDGSPISIPTVQSAISDGKAVITGRFTIAEAKQLAQRLNAGALPVPVQLISQQKVEASLGNVSIEQSLLAALIGFAAVGIFMVLYYRLPGLIAVLALCLYAIISLAIFKAGGFTLTLAGIAGFVVSVGMAVDTNVLVFERLKEELASGKSMVAALQDAFRRAWPSIRDGHVATAIGAAVLLWFGTSLIRGFGLTLLVGTLVSLFTALLVSRNLLNLILAWPISRISFLFLGKK